MPKSTAMKNAFNGTWLVLILLTVCLQFTGCSSTPIDENDPGALIKDAESEIQSDHYQLALDKLRIIKNKFPYSKYAIDAQLRIADVYFMQESFAEAAASYESFRDLHPKHDRTAYAMFRVGLSYYNDIPSNIARDLGPAKKALDSFGDFLRRFPSDGQADEARKDIGDIRRLLADKELSIGDFYYKRDFYDSAKPRYQKVIDLYPETDAAKSAQDKLAQIDNRAKREEPSPHGTDGRTNGQP